MSFENGLAVGIPYIVSSFCLICSSRAFCRLCTCAMNVFGQSSGSVRSRACLTMSEASLVVM